MSAASDKPPKPLRPAWRKEAWASRAAKAQEHPAVEKPNPDLEWFRTQAAEHPEMLNSYLQSGVDVQARRRREITKGIRAKDIIEACASRNKKLFVLQDMIDQMADACGLFKQPPSLLIHKSSSTAYPFAGKPVLVAEVALPEFISINEYSRDYFIEHPEQFKFLMAHEMAHIANGDLKVSNAIKAITKPPNRKKDVLADRMGAIIHGNPKEFAEAARDFLLYIDEHYNVDPHAHSSNYLSDYGRLRMLHKWADILEFKEATDDKGNVILDKALAVFAESKHLVSHYAERLMDYRLSPEYEGHNR